MPNLNVALDTDEYVLISRAKERIEEKSGEMSWAEFLVLVARDINARVKP